jgi:glyoxylase-like metal-dependent hydrolase (beta-lactamase superfamily II)
MATTGTAVDFRRTAPVAGSLPVQWRHGAGSRRSDPEPPIQVHWSDPHTVVLRQSIRTDYEAPFLYLLFGNDRAFLLDTGATGDPARFPLRATVDRLIAEWLAEHPRTGYELVVGHSHGHGDHVAGDRQFAGREQTVVVGTDRPAVLAFFGLADGEDAAVPVDLGGRVLEVLATPGHHDTAVTVFDPWTGWLLTGDTVYSGRLYVADLPAFLHSLDVLVAFAAERGATQVMGCHIEMSRTPGHDHPLGSTRHPDEAPLQLPVSVLAEVRDATRAGADRSGIHRFDRFVVVSGSGRRVRLRLKARAALAKVGLAR